MRLGLLGPAGGGVGALGRAAEFLPNHARVPRATYLGNEPAIGRAADARARKLVGDEQGEVVLTDDNASRRATPRETLRVGERR
jgi:hypothetical protein